jgi:hypothetical protein
LFTAHGHNVESVGKESFSPTPDPRHPKIEQAPNWIVSRSRNRTVEIALKVVHVQHRIVPFWDVEHTGSKYMVDPNGIVPPH